MERAEQYATSWTPEGRRKVEEREEGTGNERKGRKGQKEIPLMVLWLPFLNGTSLSLLVIPPPFRGD